MSADFSKLLAHLAAKTKAHAELDYPNDPLRQALYIDRGGHAPGQACPTAQERAAREPQHHYLCQWPDDECECHRYDWMPK